MSFQIFFIYHLNKFCFFWDNMKIFVCPFFISKGSFYQNFSILIFSLQPSLYIFTDVSAFFLCLATHIGFSPSPSCGLPSLRCLGLDRSIIMALFRSWHLSLPKDHSHTAKSIGLCITEQRTALKNIFISRSVVTNRRGTLYGLSLIHI